MSIRSNKLDCEHWLRDEGVSRICWPISSVRSWIPVSNLSQPLDGSSSRRSHLEIDKNRSPLALRATWRNPWATPRTRTRRRSHRRPARPGGPGSTSEVLPTLEYLCLGGTSRRPTTRLQIVLIDGRRRCSAKKMMKPYLMPTTSLRPSLEVSPQQPPKVHQSREGRCQAVNRDRDNSQEDHNPRRPRRKISRRSSTPTT